MIAGGTNDPTTSVARRRSKPRAASATSARSPISRAAAVPAGSATSNALRSSASSDGYDQPSSHGTSVVCAEDETGSSSAGPWSTPSASAWESFRLGSSGRRRIRRGPARAPALAAPAHHEQHDADDDHRDDRVVDVVQVVLPRLPVRADLLADEREREHPGDAAGEGEEREAPERHPRDAGRQRDERADDRQQAREEDGRVAVTGEPAVGGREVRGPDPDLGAVLLEDVDAPVPAHRVRDPRAGEVAEDAGGGHREQAVVPLGDVEAGEEHRRLARDRDARALEQHEPEDSGEPEVPDDVRREADERVRDRGKVKRVGEHEASRVAADPGGTLNRP